MDIRYTKLLLDIPQKKVEKKKQNIRDFKVDYSKYKKSRLKYGNTVRVKL